MSEFTEIHQEKGALVHADKWQKYEREDG